MKNIQTAIFGSMISSLFFLSGCASMVSGTSQSIQVCTSPEVGAQCYIQNDKGRWFVPCTPSNITVHRSYQDLIITAQREGYEDTTLKIKSRTRAMAFGNIIFGGAIGAGVDCADGAAYDYPNNILIPMKRSTS